MFIIVMHLKYGWRVLQIVTLSPIFISNCFNCLHVANHLIELKCRVENNRQLSENLCMGRLTA